MLVQGVENHNFNHPHAVANAAAEHANWLGRRIYNLWEYCPQPLRLVVVPKVFATLSLTRKAWRYGRLYYLASRHPESPALGLIGAYLNTPDWLWLNTYRAACCIQLLEQTEEVSRCIRLLQTPHSLADYAPLPQPRRGAPLIRPLRVFWYGELKPRLLIIYRCAALSLKLSANCFLWLMFFLDLLESLRLDVEGANRARAEFLLNVVDIFERVSKRGQDMSKQLTDNSEWLQQLLPIQGVAVPILDAANALKSLQKIKRTHNQIQINYQWIRNWLNRQGEAWHLVR